ncbi:hypothetical protein FRC02_003693 [Tulasnella sp. 418]|nr:hypothetical protein FRC02_003693 [Tulasnella sp. 418]
MSLLIHRSTQHAASSTCVAASFSTSAIRLARTTRPSTNTDGDKEDSEEAALFNGRPKVQKRVGCQTWLENEGLRYKYPRPGRPNFLERKLHPFPMNPSFRPPVPISDGLKQHIFDAYVRDPKLNSLSTLSTRFGISPLRLQAIIRLKSLELEWKEANRPLRTNFRDAMESTLGVKPFREDMPEANMYERENVTNADYDAQDALAAGPDRTKHQRGLPGLYFEGVVDGKDPIVPQLVADAKARYEAKLAKAEAEAAEFATSHRSEVPPRVEGRSSIVVIDVGNKYLDPKIEKQREKRAVARRSVKAKKATKKREAVVASQQLLKN